MFVLRKIKIEGLIFILFFLILAIFVSQLFLYLDDVNFIFPAVVGNYPVHFRNYLNDFGLFRPIDLIYKYIILTLYIKSSKIAHLIPLVVFALTSYLIYKILRLQELKNAVSLLVSLLIFSLPFSVDALSWLSANAVIYVLALFFLQIYLLEKYEAQYKLLFALLIFQIVSVFIYESTLFMPFFINLYWYSKWREKHALKRKKSQYISILIYSTAPLLLYTLSKIVITPQFETRTKLISVSHYFTNWSMIINQLLYLFSAEALRLFWFQNLYNGLTTLLSNFVAASLFIILLTLTCYFFFFKKDSIENGQINRSVRLFFWSTALFLSAIPLGWQQYYLPFRTLILPASLILIIFFFLLEKPRLINFFKTLALGILFIFLLVQISMIIKYKDQYLNDKKIVLELNRKAEELGFEHPYRTNLYLKDFPLNTVGSFVYGDYIYSLFHTSWSTEAFIDLNSGSIKNTAVKFENGEYSAKIPEDQFLKLRPLVIMVFNNNLSCFHSDLECLRVISFFKN